MNRLTRGLAAILVTVLVFTTIGCSGNQAPVTGMSGVAIEIGRAAARVGLSVTLQNAGVSPEDTQKILAELRAIVDAVIAGKNVREIIADPARWQLLRGELVTRLAAVFTGVKISGVQVFDQVTAEALIGSLLDSFAASIGNR